MRTHTVVRTIKTTCGKEITYFQKNDEVAKMHSMEGPALIYPADEKKAPEYYIFGVKYTKTKWQELVNQHKAMPVGDPLKFEF